MPSITHSPASLLTEIITKHNHIPELILITGPSGSGKSTWCAELAEGARAKGMSVGGLLSPPVIVGGSKVGIDLIDLATGERRRLAIPRGSTSPAPTICHWQFEPTTLAWGNDILRDLPPCDLVILDELGPLEFIHDGGLQEGVHLIDSRRLRVACVTIRPELRPHAQKRWPWISGIINVAHLPDET